MKKINKIIHQIWIGDQKLMPKHLMSGWKLEGFEYFLWTEKEIDDLKLENRELYNYFYNKGCYYGASDVVRIEVLRKFGGIYIDADTERLEDITDAPFMQADFFAVEANKPGRIANGIMGSVERHPILEAYIKEMGEAKKVEPVWDTIGGTMFTRIFNEKATERTMKLPSHSFYPFDSRGVQSKTLGESKTYAQHFWGSTHKSYGKI